MKTTFLMSAALLGTLAFAGAVQAQDMSGQQNAQPVSASSSAPASNLTSGSPGTAGYGGVSWNTSMSGSMARSELANCGHLSHCRPDSGH